MMVRQATTNKLVKPVTMTGAKTVTAPNKAPVDKSQSRPNFDSMSTGKTSKAVIVIKRYLAM